MGLEVIWGGYYWSTLQKDCLEHTKKCYRCQLHSDWHHAAPEQLHSISFPWSFHTTRIDILGHFPLACRHIKFLIVLVEYFTKWIEAKAVSNISTTRIKNFVWRNIVCRFRSPTRPVSNNRIQFTSGTFHEACTKLGVRQSFSSIEHPQTNRQAKAANEVIL